MDPSFFKSSILLQHFFPPHSQEIFPLISIEVERPEIIPIRNNQTPLFIISQKQLIFLPDFLIEIGRVFHLSFFNVEEWKAKPTHLHPSFLTKSNTLFSFQSPNRSISFEQKENNNNNFTWLSTPLFTTSLECKRENKCSFTCSASVHALLFKPDGDFFVFSEGSLGDFFCSNDGQVANKFPCNTKVSSSTA